jgi:uncharacterized protein (UPF0276 family)
MTKQDAQYPVSGAGLGLRRGLMNKLMADPPDEVDFMEVAPENWIHVGGRLGNKFRFFAERYPILLHGLSLSIGAPSPLNEKLLYDIKAFMAEHDIRFYSEHLSYCGDDGQLYDLMPIPFTEEAVSYVAGRIRQAQDILEQRMAVENVSYYTPTDTAMTEIEFTNRPVARHQQYRRQQHQSQVRRARVHARDAERKNQILSPGRTPGRG